MRNWLYLGEELRMSLSASCVLIGDQADGMEFFEERTRGADSAGER